MTAAPARLGSHPRSRLWLASALWVLVTSWIGPARAVDTFAPVWPGRDIPYAQIIEITLPDGTVLPAQDGLMLPGELAWIGLRAEPVAGVIDHVCQQFNLTGAWTDIDVNDDDDFYVDLNSVAGFQAGSADEIFHDDGDFIYGMDDVCTWDGGNGQVDTPEGTPLAPLMGEDGSDGWDTDRDGAVDEDGVAPQDHEEPYFVYLDFDLLHLTGDAYLRLRAVATDADGHSDPDGSGSLLLVIDVTEPPATDVLRVTNSAAEELDVWPPSMDGDGLEAVGSAPADSLLQVDVAAGGGLPIVLVDLLWRWNPSCYPNLPPLENPWRSMSAEGFTTVDTTYPYEFSVELRRFAEQVGDGDIVFFAQAVDGDGNVTPPPPDPCALRVCTNRARITTALPDTVSVGEAFALSAVLEESEDATVYFWFAERMLEQRIDAAGISPQPPYLTEPLEPAMADAPPAGDHAILRVNGVTATWHASLGDLVDPTKYDWTMTAGAIEFGALPATDDTLVVSYNVTDYAAIGEADSLPPFEGGWSLVQGGVPQPEEPWTEAYDLIATLRVAGTSGETCGLVETPVGESAILVPDLPSATGDGTAAPQRACGLAVRMSSPYKPGAGIVLRSPVSGDRVQASIHAADGRQVCPLTPRPCGQGWFDLTWDGEDVTGRDAPSGAYFLRLAVGGQQTARGFVLVR